ncbi:MAG: hypothetical protein J3R72DRAFT_448408 [Linnemannia gamsii]|nr:MAG: hypothetical protein J3R72DRAFT_448408 [Linnemannia gamsii]
MVAKLFNDLVTALDILPSSPTVDLCVNHPSPCALTGKVRVIVKRPCVYKSLVLTITGTSRVWMRQGAKTIKAKQVFLKVSKEIVFDGGNGGGSLTTGPGTAIGAREHQHQQQLHLQQRQQQQRASSLSSMSSLSNSHPSNNIPVSEETSPSTSTSTITPATAASTTTSPVSALNMVNRVITAITIPQGPTSAQPVISGEPSHGLDSMVTANTDDSSPMTHIQQGTRSGLSTPPADNSQPSYFPTQHHQDRRLSEQESTHNHSTIHNNSNNNSNSNGSGTNNNGHLQNQLRQGVNDIDFYLEFPSHVDNINNSTNTNNTTNSDSSRSLPSGPFKSFSGDSTIVYTVSATLVMSRRDILVNNQITTSIPLRVQCWQELIDWRNQSEDHSYHGKRRGKIEFRLQVPKQLDVRRLQDLQFGFDAKWRTLQDRLRIKEVHYAIIEEETQILGPRMAPNVHSTVISTAVTHDCSGDTTPTNTWTHLREAARLQIPQPLSVMESMSTPWPHTLVVSHKLRLTFRFDQSLAKERDLQLSFPILIHPTLNAAGGPVHTHALFRHLARFQPQSQRRRRARRALFGMVGAAGALEEGVAAGGDGDELSDYDEDMEYDDDEDGDSETAGGGGTNGYSGSGGSGNGNADRHLPVYADREGTLLLMVGHEVMQETTDLLAPEQVDALGISMARIPTSSMTNTGYSLGVTDRRASLLQYSPSEASMTSSGPNSPTAMMGHYSWGSAYDGAGVASSPTSTMGFSMYSTSPDFGTGSAMSPVVGMGMGSSSGGSIVSRRHSSICSNGTPAAAGGTMELSLPPPYAFPSVAEDGEEDYAMPPPSPLPLQNDRDPTLIAGASLTTIAEIQPVRSSKGKNRSDDHVVDDDDDVLMTDAPAITQNVGPSFFSSSSSTSPSSQPTDPTVVATGGGPSTVMPSFGLPSPEYEIQESPLNDAFKANGEGSSGGRS